MEVIKMVATEAYEITERNTNVRLSVEIIHQSKIISYRLIPWGIGQNRFEFFNTSIEKLEDFSEIFKSVIEIISSIQHGNPGYEIEERN